MTTYSKYAGNVQTKLGAAIPGAQIFVYLTGTTTPATLKADDGTTALPNPLTSDFNGMFGFNADVSAAYDIKTVFADVSVTITNITLPGGGGGGGGAVETVVAGDGIDVDSTDPANPIVSNIGVITIVAGTNITIDMTDPQNPVISASGGGGGSTDNNAVYDALILAYASLVSYWKCDEKSGTTLADSGPGGNTLTLSGGASIGASGGLFPIAGPIPGHAGGAVSSNGSAYASIALPTLPLGAAARTMECWVKTRDVSAKFIVSYGTFGAPTHTGCLLICNNSNNGDICASNSGDDAELNVGASLFNTGDWQYISMTYDGATTLKLYLNGALVVTKTVNAFNTVLATRGFELFDGQTFLSPMIGALAKVAVYNAALAASDILANYNTAKLGFAP